MAGSESVKFPYDPLCPNSRTQTLKLIVDPQPKPEDTPFWRKLLERFYSLSIWGPSR